MVKEETEDMKRARRFDLSGSPSKQLCPYHEHIAHHTAIRGHTQKFKGASQAGATDQFRHAKTVLLKELTMEELRMSTDRGKPTYGSYFGIVAVYLV